MPPRNSDTYSLLILDEHLWKWVDACNYSDSISSLPGREDNEVLLKRILSIWPVLLKLLNLTQSNPRPPVWLPYVIRASDRLMLSARDIPMKAIRSNIDDILNRMNEIESRATELIEIQVDREKLVFMSNYSSVTSDYHRATEYWPDWEPHVRDEALSIIRAKLEEYQTLVSKKRAELETMHLHQLAIRDRWSEMRKRLNPERYEDTATWWGACIRPGGGSGKEADSDIPEYVSITDTRLRQLKSTDFIEAIRGLTRVYLNSAAATGMSEDKSTAKIPWSILRATCLDLLKEFARALERNASPMFSSMMVASINMIDIMLRLLHCYDMSEFDSEEREISNQILQAKKEIDGFNSGIATVNPSNDPVVARFTADAKKECMQAALNRFMDGTKERNAKKREDLISKVISLEAQLHAMQNYKHTHYENPWNEVWTCWTSVVGGNSGKATPETVNTLQPATKPMTFASQITKTYTQEMDDPIQLSA